MCKEMPLTFLVCCSKSLDSRPHSSRTYRWHLNSILSIGRQVSQLYGVYLEAYGLRVPTVFQTADAITNFVSNWFSVEILSRHVTPFYEQAGGTGIVRDDDVRSFRWSFDKKKKKLEKSEGRFSISQNFRFYRLKWKRNERIKLTFSLTNGRPSEVLHFVRFNRSKQKWRNFLFVVFSALPTPWHKFVFSTNDIPTVEGMEKGLSILNGKVSGVFNLNFWLKGMRPRFTSQQMEIVLLLAMKASGVNDDKHRFKRHKKL